MSGPAKIVSNLLLRIARKASKGKTASYWLPELGERSCITPTCLPRTRYRTGH